MADRSGKGGSIAEPAVAGTLEEAGQSFGEETGGKVGGGGGGQEGDIDEGFGRVVGHGDGEVVTVVESRVLVDSEAENAINNGVAGMFPRNGVAGMFPRNGVGDGDGPLEDAPEHSGLVEVDEKWDDDRKVEEGDVFLQGMLRVGSGSVNDVVGGELKFNEEKGGVEMVAIQKELVKDGKGSHGDRTEIAASNAVEDHISNADIASENIEQSMEKEIAGVPGDEDHGMNDVSVVKHVEAKETCCSDRNVNNLGEENLENIEKLFTEMDGDELGVAASDAIEEHKSNVEFACGNVVNGVSITNTATLEGGVTAVDGGAVICERSVSGITEADQLVDDNGQEHHASDRVTDETTFNPGESETKIEMQSTCNVDVKIDGKANEMYSDPSNGGVEVMENRQPCSEEKDMTDLGCAVPNSANMVADEASAPNDDGLGDDDAMEVDEQLDGAEDLEMTDDKEECKGELKTESSRGVDEAVYLLPPDPENMFAVSNLVWGKVRSHPWWPGQIFDQSDASEKAMKYHKKDSILVAYFGDHTFAWNEASLLKPFRSYFSNAVKQSNSEGFQNAVDCALEEVSRRVELGLACSCLSKDVLDEIKVQVIENAGIQPDSCTREGVDKSADANSFKPKEFLQYLKKLALSSSSGADRLELVIAKAQLLAISRNKGFNQLPEFQSFGDLVEDDAEALDSKDNTQVGDAMDAMAASGKESVDIPKGSAHRQKHNLKDIVYHRRKERSLFELMDEAMIYSEDDEFELDGTLLAKRRRGLNTNDDSGVPDGRKSFSTGKVVSPLPKPSFKIGSCISRIASQMTGSPSFKTQNEEVGHVEGAVVNDDAERVKAGVSAKDRSLEDLLSQLQSAAVSPMGGNSFLNVITCFFSDFRNSIAVGIDLNVGRIGGKRKKLSQHAGRSSEAFEFEDMNYSYWTDRIIGNGFEDNPDEVVNGEKQFCSSEQEKPRRAGRRSYIRRRDVEVGDPLPEKPVGYVDPNSPAELVLAFPEPKFIPSEVSLNNTFKRFGTLNELQTELDRDGNRARVVFKKCRDAEVACSSASKFNIFGSLVVNYQLNYTLSEPFTTYYKPVPLPESPEDAN